MIKCRMNTELAISVITDDSSGVNSEELYKALRYVKNSAIGKKARKQLYMEKGVPQSLVNLLGKENTDINVKLEAIVCIATLCYADDTSPLAGVDFIPHLTKLLKSSDERVILTTLYSISCVATIKGANLSGLFDPTVLSKLVSYIKYRKICSDSTMKTLDSNSTKRCRYSLKTVSRMFSSSFKEEIDMAENALVPAILQLLDYKVDFNIAILETALEALSKIFSGSKDLRALMTCFKNEICSHVPYILAYCRGTNYMLKYYSALCLTEIFKTGVLPSEFNKEISLPLLVTAINLLSNSDSSLGETSEYPPQDGIMAMLFSILNSDSLLHTPAIESGIVKIILPILSNIGSLETEQKQGSHQYKQDSTSSSVTRDTSRNAVDTDLLTINALLILSSLCSVKDDCRKQIIDADFLPEITKKLSHPNSKVRAAACKCARNLTRSTKNLSTSFLKSGMTDPFINLLYDEDIDVQVIATATMCNIILAYPSAKRFSLVTTTLDRLILFTESPNNQLRLHAVWALKNFAYNAESKVKVAIMQRLPCPKLETLLRDPCVSVQEETLNLLRNVTCGKDEDVNQAFLSIGTDEFFNILDEKLMTGSQKAILHSLYIMVNISSSISAYKNKIVENKAILQSVMKHTSHPDPFNRVAALWCIINFSWSDDDYSHIIRVSKLCESGFEKRLFEILVDDSNTDVKDRARMALLNFGHSLLDNNTAEVNPEVSNERSDNAFAQESSTT